MIRKLAKTVLPDGLVKLIQAALGKSQVIVPGPLTYQEDGLATQHRCDFLVDPLFAESYRLAHATGSWGTRHLHWRVYLACWAAQWAQRLPGDFVECGVNRGGLARAIVHYLGFEKLPKKFYLLDTFCGLVDKQISPEERARGIDPGHYPECFAAVEETFRPFANVCLVRGSVPDTLSQVSSTQVAYLSLDMNCVYPEIAAATFFWDKLAPHAVVLLDDYGWSGHEEQKRAFDEFAANRGLQVLALPTGQGLLFKP